MRDRRRNLLKIFKRVNDFCTWCLPLTCAYDAGGEFQAWGLSCLCPTSGSGMKVKLSPYHWGKTLHKYSWTQVEVETWTIPNCPRNLYFLVLSLRLKKGKGKRKEATGTTSHLKTHGSWLMSGWWRHVIIWLINHRSEVDVCVCMCSCRVYASCFVWVFAFIRVGLGLDGFSFLVSWSGSGIEKFSFLQNFFFIPMSDSFGSTFSFFCFCTRVKWVLLSPVLLCRHRSSGLRNFKMRSLSFTKAPAYVGFESTFMYSCFTVSV